MRIQGENTTIKVVESLLSGRHVSALALGHQLCFGFATCILILFGKHIYKRKAGNLRADEKQKISAAIRSRIFCLPICYLKIQRLKYTGL
jgi:hypothetical protein